MIANRAGLSVAKTLEALGAALSYVNSHTPDETKLLQHIAREANLSNIQVRRLLGAVFACDRAMVEETPSS